jgi:hypothetical protein
MSANKKQRLRTGAVVAFRILALLATGLSSMTATAQPVLDAFISEARVTQAKGCALLSIKFNTRIRYAGHFPLDRGDELHISLFALDRESVEWVRGAQRESANLVDGEPAGVHSVTLDATQAAGPDLRIHFDQPTAYQIQQSPDFEHLNIIFTPTGSKAVCGTSSPFRAGQENGAAGTSEKGSPKRISAAELKFIEASMDEARAAIKRQRFVEAQSLLKKVLSFPENEHTGEARELLVRAGGSSGAADRSQIELQDYKLRFPEGNEAANPDKPSVLGSGRDATPGQATGPKAPATAVEPNKDVTQFQISGGVSSFFVKDDSVNTSKDISIAPDPNADPDAHRLHQNMFLSNFDIFGTLDNDLMRSKFKLSGTDEQSSPTNSLDTNRYGVSTAYWESQLKESDVMARIGRQTRNTGGVLGRFDGAVLSWGYSDSIKLNAVAGAANWSRFDAPGKDSRFLYGASIDILKPVSGLDLSLYAIQQSDRWLLDRRALGAEFRYFQNNLSALATIDYDVHFGTLNAAIGSGSWTFDDKSVISGSFDYRRVPYLASWNALQGQPFMTLYDLLKYDTQAEVQRWAMDRTPLFKSAMASYTRPLNENFQFVVDGTVTHLSGTPPSGGVDGTFPTGTEYYFSGQLMGQNLFAKGDMYSSAIRYAHLAGSQVYFLDLNARYPLSEELRVNPRLRVGLQNGSGPNPTTPLFLVGPSITSWIPGLRQTTILPSVLLDYSLTKDLFLETELGTKWIGLRSNHTQTTTKDLYMTLGLRASFSNEGAYRCAGLLTPCIGMFNSSPKGEAVAGQEQFYAFTDASVPLEKPAEPSAFLLESGLRYVGTTGHNAYNYFADDTTTARVSRLSYSGLWANSGEFFFRGDIRRGVLRDVFIKGYAGGGSIGHGALYDEDFPPWAIYSKTISQASGNLRYATLDLGYNLYTDPRIRLGAFIGFHGWRESVSARGCTQIGLNPEICQHSIPLGVTLVNERDQWNTFRAGGVLDVNLTDRLSWNGEVAMVAVSQHARDNHYFTFGVDPARGQGAGFELESLLKYQLTDNLSLGVGGRWWHFSTNATDLYGQLLTYRTDRIGVFGQLSYKTDFFSGFADSHE